MGKKHRRMHDTHEEAHEELSFLHGRPLIPSWWRKADTYQRKYDAAIDFAKVVMVDAEAGTGKTTIAVKKGLEYLSKGLVSCIAYIRYVDGRTMKLGALPGSLGEKEHGFMYPFYEALEECGLSEEQILELQAKKLIEASTDIFWRGRNMKDTFLIIDECQNGSIEDMQLILTRLHDAGKGLAIGHSAQVDRKLPRYGPDKLLPFQVYQLHMAKKPWTKLIHLENNYRGEISQWADKVKLTIQELEDAANENKKELPKPTKLQ